MILEEGWAIECEIRSLSWSLEYQIVPLQHGCLWEAVVSDNLRLIGFREF